MTTPAGSPPDHPGGSPRRGLAPLAGRLPAEVRALLRQEAAAVAAELRTVRRPRDLRRLAQDPEALTRLTAPVAPGVDRILDLVTRHAVTLPPGTTEAVLAATSMAGAGAGSALELCSLIGMEIPPVAFGVAGAAGGVAVAAELVEFYLIASEAWRRLDGAGMAEPSVLRRVLLEAYVGNWAGDDQGGGGPNRLTRALLKRAFPRLVPVLGIPAAGRSTLRDLRRSRAAVERVVAGDPGRAEPPAPG